MGNWMASSTSLDRPLDTSTDTSPLLMKYISSATWELSASFSVFLCANLLVFLRCSQFVSNAIKTRPFNIFLRSRTALYIYCFVRFTSVPPLGLPPRRGPHNPRAERLCLPTPGPPGFVTCNSWNWLPVEL